MNDTKRSSAVVRIIVVFVALILLGVGGFYLWLRSTASWGAIGTISGGDARPGRNEFEMKLRDKLYQWLEERGFGEGTIPESLAAAHGQDWAGSIGSPTAYTNVIDGDELYFLICDVERDSVKYWRASIYYKTVPSDAQWLPGVEAGKDSAGEIFESARQFIRKTRDAEPPQN